MSEVGAYADFVIQTRPEIRKGCVWDISLLFSLEALSKNKLKEIYLEKPRVQRESGAYLCLKVRSKLIQKEIGFSKVGELEHDHPFIEPNLSTGSATLKVKFMQRPRAVFHRHADVMVLVVALRSCVTNEVLMTAEHELIFRGGTGSMHSAERKKAVVVGSPHPHHHHHHAHVQGASSATSAAASAFVSSLPNSSPYLLDASHASHLADPASRSSHLAHTFASPLLAASHLPAQSALGATGSPNSRLASRASPRLPALSQPSSQAHSFARPTPEHFAISDAVTRAHPQVSTLFPQTGSSGATQPLSSSSETAFSSSNYFLHNSGAFLLDTLPGETAEQAPHYEVQPLTLEALQEFQIGLEQHCNAVSTPSTTTGNKQFANSTLTGVNRLTSSGLPLSASSGSTASAQDEFDFSNLSPSNGLTATEDSSNTDLDDARELDAWAATGGFDTTLFDTTDASSTLDLNSNPMGLSCNAFHPIMSENIFASETSFLATTQSMNPALSSTTSGSHSLLKYETTIESDSMPIESAMAVSAESGLVGGNVGAVTRARSAKMLQSNVSSKKRRAGFDPEFLPTAKSSIPRAESGESLLGAAAGSFEDKVFQKLFFRSLTFLTLEELRALAQTAPLPIFVKDEQGAYLLANPAFCSFVYDENWDSIANRSAQQLLEAEESERIHRADEYIMAREGNIGTFYLSVKHQDYRVMKLYTKLRDCDQKLVVGAVTF